MNAAAALPARYPTRAKARRAIFALAALGFFLSMDITLTTLLIEPMKRGMGLSDLQIGLLQGTVFGLAFGLASIPLGWLIDRADRRRLLLYGLLAWMAATTLTALAQDFATLVMARIALGVVAALAIPASLSLVADLYAPRDRSVATSMFVIGQACGQAFGILAGGLAYDALTGFVMVHPSALGGLAVWRAVYLGAALIGVVPLALVSRIAEPERKERIGPALDARRALHALWSHRRFLVPLLGALLFTQITLQATSVWAAPVLIRNHGLTPGAFAGWLSAVMVGGGIAGALAGGRLGEIGRRRGGRARVLLPALIAALAIAPLSLFALAPDVPTFAALLALNIFAGAIIATLGVVSITLNMPNEIRGLALGANVFTSTVFGTAVAPVAIAVVSKALGGEAKLGAAIAAISAPSALLASMCFAFAVRFGAKATTIS